MPGMPEGGTVTDDDFAQSACERARHLVEEGDLAGAASEFQRVLARGETRFRGEAAFGLSVVREAQGDIEGGREACRLALHTRDHEYAPRAAYNLALSYERSGERGEARVAWQAVIDAGNERYVPGALCGLAALAADSGDSETAEQLWGQAAETGDAEYAPLAAHNLGAARLGRGELAAAQQAFATAAANDRNGHGHVNLGVTYLERALSAFQEALACDDAETYPLAAELLARTLPLRGDYAEARQTWEQALAHSDPHVNAEVRARLQREFGHATNPDGAWWTDIVEAAVCSGTVPELAAELCTALGAVYEAAGEPELVRQIVASYSWGERLDPR